MAVVVLSSGRRVPMARVLHVVDADGHERTFLRGGQAEPLLEDDDVRKFFATKDEADRLAEGGGAPEPVELRARRLLEAISRHRKSLSVVRR